LYVYYSDTTGPREPHNPKLLRTTMPQRYWETMTEFQDESYFTAQAGTEELPAPNRKEISTQDGEGARANHWQSGSR